MPMGSFHIIDGEKVSVRYGGQEWTCARCHQFKRDCPGGAVARECTADRVLLSTCMEEDWKNIGYIPDADTSNNGDNEVDITVNVVSKKPETKVIPDNTHSMKYSYVIIKGLRKDTSRESILEIQGLKSIGSIAPRKGSFCQEVRLDFKENKHENISQLAVYAAMGCLTINTPGTRRWSRLRD